MKTRTAAISIFFCLLTIFCAASRTFGQTYDISSGGQPTITGALNGSVTGSSSVLDNLSVTLNFGEISPANTNSIVKVVVPIAIRSTQPYQVTVSLAGTGSANAQGVQTTDVGFGMNNFHSMGANARVCTASSHIFYSPFSNDPAATVTINASGRVSYQSTLANISGSTVIVSGPRLSQTAQARRNTDNGYSFDAIFVITPQFYASGSFSVTLTFNISSGPSVPCT